MSIQQLHPANNEDVRRPDAVDIIAIHGLNPLNKDDHSTITWEEPKSGHLWLRDALPKECPNARILLYSYSSSPAFSTAKERFIHRANTLLECVRIHRRKNPKRPLIFVGHSLGGILIKQALVNAQQNAKYKDIKEATFGLVFFGTPHAGPSKEAKVKFGKACVSVIKSLPGVPSNDMMEALKHGSLFADTLQEGFCQQLEHYQIVSFYEGIGDLVPRESAVIGLPGERENKICLAASHSDMCRFNPETPQDCNNYRFVEANIGELYEAAAKKGEIVEISPNTIPTSPGLVDHGITAGAEAEENDGALLGRLHALRN